VRAITSGVQVDGIRPPRPADTPDDARRELRRRARLVQIVPPSGPGGPAEDDRCGQGRRVAHPAPVPLLELPQQSDRLRVHRAVGHRGSALASPRGEVVEGRLSVSIRQDALVCRPNRIKDRTPFGGMRLSVR